MPLPVVSHPGYEVDIGPHVFPMAKYRLVRERLLAAGAIAQGDLLAPEPVTDDETVPLLNDIEAMGVEIYSCGTCLNTTTSNRS